MNVFSDNEKCAFTNTVNISEDINDDWKLLK